LAEVRGLEWTFIGFGESLHDGSSQIQTYLPFLPLLLNPFHLPLLLPPLWYLLLPSHQLDFLFVHALQILPKIIILKPIFNNFRSWSLEFLLLYSLYKLFKIKWLMFFEIFCNFPLYIVLLKVFESLLLLFLLCQNIL